MDNASSGPLLYFKIAIVHSVKDFALSITNITHL